MRAPGEAERATPLRLDQEDSGGWAVFASVTPPDTSGHCPPSGYVVLDLLDGGKSARLLGIEPRYCAGTE